VRRGVAEVNENVPEKVDATIGLPRKSFARIMTGDTTLTKEIEAGTAKVQGSQEAVTEGLNSFDKVAKVQSRPEHLHP